MLELGETDALSPASGNPRKRPDVPKLLEELGDLLAIDGADRYRVQAYRNAARTLRSLMPDLAPAADLESRLDQLSGIGPDLAHKIAELARTGSCPLLEQVRARVPVALLELLQLPGIGPARVRVLHVLLGVTDMASLHQAAAGGRLRTLPRFGAATEQHVLRATAEHMDKSRRFPLALAQALAQAWCERLRGLDGVQRAEIAGSVRRQRETVGDIDLVAASRTPAAAVRQLVRAGGYKELLVSGATSARLMLDEGVQLDVRVVMPESFGSAWLHLTGSRQHNIALRRLARQRGMLLSEYALSRFGRRIAGLTEESIFQALGLPWTDPRQREAPPRVDAA